MDCGETDGEVVAEATEKASMAAFGSAFRARLVADGYRSFLLNILLLTPAPQRNLYCCSLRLHGYAPQNTVPGL